MQWYPHLMAGSTPIHPLEKSRWLGAAVAGLGLWVALGWILHQPLWTTVLPGLVSMKFNTSLCFIAMGAGQYLFVREWVRRGEPLSRWPLILPLAVVLVAASTLVEYLAGVSLGLDEFLIRDIMSPVGTAFPGRMGSNTATAFLSSGLALMLLRLDGRWAVRSANLLAIVSLLIASAGLFGYLFSIRELYTFQSATQMALHTAVGLFLLNLALLASQSRMLLARLLLDRGIGAWLILRLGPVLIVIPFLLGDLLLDSIVGEWFTPSFSVAILAAGITVLLLVALIVVAVSLQRLDAARASAVTEKEALLEQLRQHGQNLESMVKVRTLALEAANRDLERESQERKSVADRLKGALDLLERSHAELRQYTTVASRDLIEPLQKVASSLHLLARKLERQLDPEAQHLIREALSDAGRMQTLIRDFLDFARLGDAEPKKARTNLDRVLAAVLGSRKADPRYARARITSGTLPVVLADPGQAEILLGHLLDNAVTYRGPEHPRVHLEAAREGEDWILSVSDNGIGIAEEDRETIFVMFRKLHSREEYPGSGMGLAVSRKIAERHGGALTVESKPGQGSVFRIRWPVGHTPRGIPEGA